MTGSLFILLFAAANVGLCARRCDVFDYYVGLKGSDVKVGSKRLYADLDKLVSAGKVCRTNIVLAFKADKVEIRYIQQNIVKKTSLDEKNADRNQGYYKIFISSSGEARRLIGLPDFECVSPENGAVDSLFDHPNGVSMIDGVARATGVMTFECDIDFKKGGTGNETRLYDTLRVGYGLAKHMLLRVWKNVFVDEIMEWANDFYSPADLSGWYNDTKHAMQRESDEKKMLMMSGDTGSVRGVFTTNMTAVTNFIQRKYVPFVKPTIKKSVSGAQWAGLGLVLFIFTFSLAWAVFTIYHLTRPTGHCDSHKSHAAVQSTATTGSPKQVVPKR